MSCKSYCEFGESLADTSYNHGLPRCLSDTVSCVILLLFVLLAGIPQLIWIVQKRKRRKYHYQPIINDDLEQSIDAPASDLLLNKESTSSFSVQERFLDNPAGFIYGENYHTSFMYTCQLFFHICQISLPLIDLVVKGSIDSSRLQGVTVVKDALTFLTWFLAYFVLVVETQNRYHARISHYSTALLLYWGLAFIDSNLSLVSWNSQNWWFQRKTSVEKVEFVLFWGKYSFSALILFLGMKASGLHKPTYQLSVDENGVTETANVMVSTVPVICSACNCLKLPWYLHILELILCLCEW